MPEQTGLRRELGLRDVTLFAISCIVGVRWIPGAAHAGPGSVTLWLLAAVFFVAPLAVAVAKLSVKYPGTGGLYLWTRNDFGPWHGFLCFWVYWMSVAFWFPTAAIFYVSVSFHALGPSYSHLADNRLYLVTASLVAIWTALGTNIVGMKIGKWTENVGAAATWGLGLLFVALAALVWSARGSATHIDIRPQWSWGTVSFGAATIAYAMTGLELAALMGGEIHQPERNLPRAGWIASGFATFFYAGMTLALLVLLPPSQIDDRHGLAQGAEVASSLLHALWLSPMIAILILVTALGQFGGIGSAVSRLPFAVGVDKLLPAVLGRVHPRWGTPHVSIIALGAVASAMLVGFQLGDTAGAIYDSLVSMMVIAGFVPYVYIFGSAWKAGKRLSALAGWSVTVTALVCSVVPSPEITKVWLFETKLAVVTLALVVSAWVVYRRSAA